MPRASLPLTVSLALGASPGHRSSAGNDYNSSIVAVATASAVTNAVFSSVSGGVPAGGRTTRDNVS